jgi:zinc protease
MHYRSFLPLLLLCLALPSPSRADDLGAKAAKALYEDLRTAELPNGLKIFLKPIPGSTAVTSIVIYKVGSCDEDKTSTGLAHYLEHLLFKGTDKLKPGDVDRITFRAGGSNNAYTSNDVTAYFFTLPSDRWKDALEIEADRMRNTRIDKAHEFDKEKGAVINELIGNEDGPWDLEYKALVPLLFGKDHPYGHPIIGETAHVKDATEKIITDFYDRWYYPNNASIVLVGGFDPDQALATIKKLFGPIKAGKLPERKKVPAAEVKLPQRKEFESKFSVARMLIGYPSVQIGHEDQPALEVLEAILSSGKRSRLYRSLIDGKAICSSADVDSSPGRITGWVSVSAEALPGKDRKEVEKLVLAELAKVREELVSEAELKRVKQQLLASTVFGKESTFGLARTIAEGVTNADLDFVKKYLPRVQAVTAEDVRRVAKKYLDPEKSVTVWSVPPEKKMGMASPSSSKRKKVLLRENRDEAGTKAATSFDLTKAKRVVLPNGLTVVLFENKRLPIFEARFSLREVDIYQNDDQLGIASLTGSMLDEGTTKRSSEEIAEAIEAVGGELSLGGVSGSVKTLSTDRKMGLETLFECLLQPSFPKDAFTRIKERQLAEIGEEEVQPRAKAQLAFNAAVFGKHPRGRASNGTLKTVGALSEADCKAFHGKVFVPNNTIFVVVGDFDAKEVQKEIETLTASWKKNELARPKLPEIKLPEKFTQEVISMPKAAQLQMFFGHVGIRRDNADYHKLLVLDYILGTGSGFTDRLSSRVRDREGLAYTVSGSITAAAGVEPGAFRCYVGTDNDNFDKVKTIVLEELNRIRDTKPSGSELSDTKAYLIGSGMLQFSSNAGIASQLIAIERYDLGFDYLEKFRKDIAAVTAEDVQSVAKKYIHPDKMFLIAAGGVDKKGEPLKK